MFGNIGWGTIAAGLGACAVPFVAPATAVPVITALAGAGAGVAWELHKAQIVHDVAMTGMKVANDRSRELMQALERFMFDRGIAIDRIANTWNHFAIAGLVAAGSIGLNYFAQAASRNECASNPLLFLCLHNTAVNIATTFTTFTTTIFMGAKACSLLKGEGRTAGQEQPIAAPPPEPLTPARPVQKIPEEIRQHDAELFVTLQRTAGLQGQTPQQTSHAPVRPVQKIPEEIRQHDAELFATLQRTAELQRRTHS